MFTIYTSDAYQQESNCVYSHPVEVVDEASFKRAVSHDHVCAKYRNNYRGNDNFISSDCLPVDCDNDHSDDPAGWKTPADIRKALPGVFFAVHYSRHNNRPKDGKSARPRFHLFFQIDPMTGYEAYAALKQLLHEIFPYLDANALDAARFLYGTRDPKVEFHPGGKTLTDFLYGDEFDKDMPGGYEKQATIPEGSRNTTMFRWAVRSMKRYGDTEESKNAYFTEAEKCQPPLSTDELNHIWKSAQKYYAKIASQPGYVSPQEYNNPNPGWDEPLPFSRYTMAPFPVDALPEPIANYVKAVAESTQTSVDMAGSIAISVLSTCLQKKYRIQGKSDWVEPLNTYVIVIAPPSERKSSVLHLMLQPVNDYEVEYNKTNAAAVEAGRMQKRVLERRQKALEEKVAKGTADPEELERIAQEVADFEETNPLQLYVDDITTEKLVSVIASNHGHASLISSEGGIFDTLSGIYTRNVNIDVMLKGYSGDTDPRRPNRQGQRKHHGPGAYHPPDGAAERRLRGPQQHDLPRTRPHRKVPLQHAGLQRGKQTIPERGRDRRHLPRLRASGRKPPGRRVSGEAANHNTLSGSGPGARVIRELAGAEAHDRLCGDGRLGGKARRQRAAHVRSPVPGWHLPEPRLPWHPRSADGLRQDDGRRYPAGPLLPEPRAGRVLRTAGGCDVPECGHDPAADQGAKAHRFRQACRDAHVPHLQDGRLHPASAGLP
jgi:hypothetical protein